MKPVLFLLLIFAFSLSFSSCSVEADLQTLNDALVASMDSTVNTDTTTTTITPTPIPTDPTFQILNTTTPTTSTQAGNNVVQYLLKFWQILENTRCMCLQNAATAKDCLADGVYFYALKNYKDIVPICANVARYCATQTPCTDNISAFIGSAKTDFVWTLVVRKVLNELTIPIDNEKPDLNNWCNQFIN